MTDQVRSLQQRMQQQATQSAQGFYGNSVGGIKSRIQDDRTQLESFVQQMPQGDAQARVQKMIDSYNELESSMDQAAQEQGVQHSVSQAQTRQSANGTAQQAQKVGEAGESGAQTTRRTVDEQGYITETAFDENGGVVDEGVVGNVAELPVEEEYIDEQSRIVSQVRDDAGNAYELVTDDEGNMVEARAV